MDHKKGIFGWGAVLATIIMTANTAHALPKFYLGGMYNSTSPSDGQSTAYAGTAGFGGMAGIQGMLGSLIGIELDVTYLQRSFDLTGKNISVTGTYVDVPLLMWLNFAEFFGIGAGVYGTYGVGLSRSGKGANSTAMTFGEASLKSYTGGAMGAARISIFTSSFVGLFLEGRYLYGLFNHASIDKFYYNDAQVLLGLRIGGGK